MTAASPVVLEPAAQQVAEAFSKPPFLYEMAPADARKVLENAQSGPVSKFPVDEEWITVPAQVGDVRVRIIRPQGATGTLAVIVYMHGGGWILGNAGTHDRLVRELAVGARAALAFVEYPNSPEARYPTAIEQGYATAQWITRNGASKGLDASRMAVAGESVGGNMTAALALMAKERGDVTFVQQSIDDQCVPPAGDLLDLGHALVVLLLLVGGVDDRPRDGVSRSPEMSSSGPRSGFLVSTLASVQGIQVGRCGPTVTQAGAVRS